MFSYDAELDTSADRSCPVRGCPGFDSSVKLECRVCGRCCHTSCLTRKNKGDQHAMAAMENAGTDKGWSCFNCENIGSLLEEEDTQLMMDNFDQHDPDQNTQVTVDEFVAFQQNLCRQMKGRELSEAEEQTARDAFDNIDINRDGSIGWWEFVTAESVRFLQKKPKEYLLKKLTPREIQRVRDIYKEQDFNGQGMILKDNYQEVIKQWMDGLGLEPKDGDYTKYLLVEPGIVQWDTFLREHAISILSARPNISGKKHFLPTAHRS
ncbi:PHD finger protein 24-like [Branchiostoma floridae x Branchiostoma belcheri]